MARDKKRFTLRVGLFNRNVLSTIKQVCFKNKMDISITKLDDGWWWGCYGIEIDGDVMKVRELVAKIKKSAELDEEQS